MDIQIKSRDSNMGWHFTVTVDDGHGQSVHNVTMAKDFVLRIGAHFEPEKVIEESFGFLLEREPKEKILQEFDITTISHYYPEFVRELEKRLNS